MATPEQLIELAKKIDNYAWKMEDTTCKGLEEEGTAASATSQTALSLEIRLRELNTATVALLIAAGVMKKSDLICGHRQEIMDVINGAPLMLDIQKERRQQLREKFPWNKQEQY